MHGTKKMVFVVKGMAVEARLGSRVFLVLPDGTCFEPSGPLQKALRLLWRRLRQADRKQEGSSNQRKALLRVEKLQRRIQTMIEREIPMENTGCG